MLKLGRDAETDRRVRVGSCRLLPGNPNPVPLLVQDDKLLSLLTLRLNLRLAELRNTQW